METFKRVLVFAKPYGKYWPKYLVFIILTTIFTALNLALVEPLINFIFQNHDAPRAEIMTQLPDFQFQWSFDYLKNYLQDAFNFLANKIEIDKGPMAVAAVLVLVLVFTSLLANLFKYISQRVLVRLRADTMRNMRKALFVKLSSLHIGYFNTRKKGDIISVVSNDVSEVQSSIISSLQVIFREPFMIIVYVTMLFYYSVPLTILTLIALPISGLLIARVVKALRRYANDTQSILGQIISFFDESISGIRIIKGFNAQGYINKNFDEQNNRFRDSLKRMLNRQTMATPLSEFLGVTILALIVLYAGYLNMGGASFSAGAFMVYLALYYYVLTSAKTIINEFGNIQRGLASAQRVLDILDTENPIKESPNPARIQDFTDSIQFDNVCFAYGNEPVIRSVNLTVPKGKTYALVGHSGAGKTTLADLIPRFYDVDSGELKIDGVNIKDYKMEDLIGLMGIVTQEAILFNDTVHNNIAFGSKNVTEAQVIEAAKIANAHEFIVQMENGYQSNIGDRGGKLSGGQRQRLSIARAVLKNPPILILDEATSALDTESERLVQDALTKLMKDRTSIIIAHRLSTIQHADQIVVLQKGEIIEQGTHNELFNKKGVYHNLCKMQAFE